MHEIDIPILSAVWSTDQDGALCSLFEQYSGLLGIGAGQSLVGWIRGSRLDSFAVACTVDHALRTGMPFRHELQIIGTDRHARRVLLTGLPQHAGAAYRFTGAIVDLTLQQAALDEAMRSEAKHRLILDNSDDLIAHSDADGRYVHVSSSYTRLMGWTPGQMIGERVIDFLHPDDRQRAHDALAHLVTPGAKPLVTEVRKRDAAGAHISLATKACPVIDPVTGSSLGVALVSRDITQEQAMRRQLQDMANDKLALVESIDDGFFSVNTRWEITYANGRAAAFVGADRETVAGKYLWDVAPGLAESTIGAHYRQAMETRQSMCFEEFYEPYGVWLSERIYAYKDGLSVFFHDISERKEAEAKLERLATRDSLTGLPNRAWINGRVDAMLAQPDSEGLTTVLFIDLNRFKQVNDSLGHAAGDLLLQQVGERLKKCMRPGDVVARLGGDEFVVAARCIGREAAAAIAQRLLAALTAPFHAEDLEMSVGASIGICQAPAGSATTQQLFQCADMAMYKVKARGTGDHEFYEPSMHAEAGRRPQPGRLGLAA